MHVLITGGCGFVGRHFTKCFFDLGWEITIVDNLISDSSIHPTSWMKHLRCPVHHYIEMDCIKYFDICTIQFDLVLHLATVVIKDNPLAITHNLAIDSYFFQWVVKTKPKKVVYFSSSAAYRDKIKEGDCWSKMTGEMLAKMVHEKHNINIVCYRPFLGYGEDQHKNNPFTNILHKVFMQQKDLDIYSNTIRDFVYIEDVVDCVLTTMNKVKDGSPINICTGVGTSFVELVNLIRDVYSQYEDRKIIIQNDKPTGLQYCVGDPTLAKSLGWEYKTCLTNGINIILDYWETNSI